MCMSFTSDYDSNIKLRILHKLDVKSTKIRVFEAFAKNLIKNRQEDQWDQQEEFLLVALFCGYFLSSRLPLSSDPTPADRKII